MSHPSPIPPPTNVSYGWEPFELGAITDLAGLFLGVVVLLLTLFVALRQLRIMHRQTEMMHEQGEIAKRQELIANKNAEIAEFHHRIAKEYAEQKTDLYLDTINVGDESFQGVLSRVWRLRVGNGGTKTPKPFAVQVRIPGDLAGKVW